MGFRLYANYQSLPLPPPSIASVCPITSCLSKLTPLAEAETVSPSIVSATVISTGDGDTLRVQTAESGSPITVGIGCIDAPKTSQVGGEWSAQQLVQLLPAGTQIEIAPLDTDDYGRTVAEVWQSSRSINLELVKFGAAVAYP